MIPLAFRIFRVSPVIGIRGIRSIAIHVPFAAGGLSGDGMFCNGILRKT